MGGKAALVEVLRAVVGALSAVCLVTPEAFVTVAATVRLVALAYAIALLQETAVWSDCLDNANALVAENHVYSFLGHG
jgi:hypothetical protein